MPQSWTQQRDQELLLAIEASHPIDWAAVVEQLDDTTVTANALRKHMTAIKKQLKDGNGEKPTAGAKAAPPKKAAKPASKPASKPAAKRVVAKATKPVAQDDEPVDQDTDTD
ncbi:unnamed protein product [Penicillium bialowiezense]